MSITSFGPLAWTLFGVIVLAMLVVDLRCAAERHQGLRAAAIRTTIWMFVGLGFGVGIYLSAGRDAGLAYWAAYLLEKPPSVDNLFVFVLVFA